MGQREWFFDSHVLVLGILDSDGLFYPILMLQVLFYLVSFYNFLLQACLLSIANRKGVEQDESTGEEDLGLEVRKSVIRMYNMRKIYFQQKEK